MYFENAWIPCMERGLCYRKTAERQAGRWGRWLNTQGSDLATRMPSLPWPLPSSITLDTYSSLWVFLENGEILPLRIVTNKIVYLQQLAQSLTRRKNFKT